MNRYAENSENKNCAPGRALNVQNKNTGPASQFKDSPSKSNGNRELQEAAINSPTAKQFKAYQEMANDSAKVRQLKALQAMADNRGQKEQLLELCALGNPDTQSVKSRQRHAPGLPGQLKTSGVIQRVWEYNADTGIYYEGDTNSEFALGESRLDLVPNGEWPMARLIHALVTHENATPEAVAEIYSILKTKWTIGAGMEEVDGESEEADFTEEADFDEGYHADQGNELDTTQIISGADEKIGSRGAGPCVIFMLVYNREGGDPVVTVKHVDIDYENKDKMIALMKAMRVAITDEIIFEKEEEEEEEDVQEQQVQLNVANERWYFAGGELNESTTYSDYVGIYEAVAELGLNVGGMDVVRNVSDGNEDLDEMTAMKYQNGKVSVTNVSVNRSLN